MRSKIYPLCMLFVTVLFGINQANADRYMPPFPVCRTNVTTFSETSMHSDVILLAKWVSEVKSKEKNDRQTTFQVLEVGKQNINISRFQKSQHITIKLPYDGKKGDLFLLIGYKGKQGKNLTWNNRRAKISKAVFYHLQEVPSPKVPVRKRLLFYLNFLEFHDTLIAYDAFEEFQRASHKDIAAIADQLPHDDLRKWLIDKKTPTRRIGMYAMMLGLCGTEKDIPLLKTVMSKSKPIKYYSHYLRTDGIIAGYLLLSGTNGLSLIDRTKLNNKKCPPSDTHSAMKALQLVSLFGKKKISTDRLQQSLRILLDRPEFVWLAVTYLDRWKDWSVQDKLMKIYDDDQENKYSIILYFLACSVDVPNDSKLPEPKHVTQAKKYLKTLEEKDPKIVKAVKKHFFTTARRNPFL